MKRIMLILMTVVAVSAIAEPIHADQPQTLSGVLREQLKSEFTYYLELDGMTGNINVTGEALSHFKAGDHILVEGIIKTRLWNPSVNGSMQQQSTHWVIFMDVRSAKSISAPFGLNEQEIIEPVRAG